MEIERRTVRTTERDGRAWIDADEAALFTAWRLAHERPDIPADILPRLGVVAVLDGRDSAAGWLYMDNSVGVGFVEWLVTRPGLTVPEAKACISAIFDELAEAAKTLGYGLLIGHCTPSLHRIATRELGWHDLEGESKPLALALV